MWNDGRPLLEVHDLHAGYDAGRDVVRGASLHVRAHEIVCVIGPNGAGKSTLLGALYGLTPKRRGRVLFDDRDIIGSRPHDGVRSAGIALVPQQRSIFPRMSVKENLVLGLHQRRDRAVTRARLADAYAMFPQLRRPARRRAGEIDVAEQRMLELARALMWRPRLVLVDELSAGLAPPAAASIFEELRRLRAEADLTILMCEQNARQALSIADRGYVLHLGRQIFEGTGAELLSNVAVRRSLLGEA
ncbi:MAG TPA: ABC transporter ATP-binding protein [Egibacteraceae bacterium]|nr:ABC transporter ATP-binding protein [Egibacteraceae bacterium]